MDASIALNSEKEKKKFAVRGRDPIALGALAK
jgi:hypothetical protein